MAIIVTDAFAFNVSAFSNASMTVVSVTTDEVKRLIVANTTYGGINVSAFNNADTAALVMKELGVVRPMLTGTTQIASGDMVLFVEQHASEEELCWKRIDVTYTK